jgi:hypothetical protein
MCKSNTNNEDMGSIHGWGTQKYIYIWLKEFLKLLFTNNIYMKQS